MPLRQQRLHHKQVFAPYEAVWLGVDLLFLCLEETAKVAFGFVGDNYLGVLGGSSDDILMISGIN
jgi:hypothetical protein